MSENAKVKSENGKVKRAVGDLLSAADS